jgi:hypothetical protein
MLKAPLESPLKAPLQFSAKRRCCTNLVETVNANRKLLTALCNHDCRVPAAK